MVGNPCRMQGTAPGAPDEVARVAHNSPAAQHTGGALPRWHNPASPQLLGCACALAQHPPSAAPGRKPAHVHTHKHPNKHPLTQHTQVKRYSFHQAERQPHTGAGTVCATARHAGAQAGTCTNSLVSNGDRVTPNASSRAPTLHGRSDARRAEHGRQGQRRPFTSTAHGSSAGSSSWTGGAGHRATVSPCGWSA